MCYLRVGNLKALYGDHKAAHLIHPNGPLQKKPCGQKEFAVGDLNPTLATFGETAGPDDSEERLNRNFRFDYGRIYPHESRAAWPGEACGGMEMVERP